MSSRKSVLTILNITRNIIMGVHLKKISKPDLHPLISTTKPVTGDCLTQRFDRRYENALLYSPR